MSWSIADTLYYLFNLMTSRDFFFLYMIIVNWLQRTKNTAKQGISPLSDMQHVNRLVKLVSYNILLTDTLSYHIASRAMQLNSVYIVHTK